MDHEQFATSKELEITCLFIAPLAVGQGAPQAINCPLGRRPRGSTGD